MTFSLYVESVAIVKLNYYFLLYTLDECEFNVIFRQFLAV